MSGSGSSTHPDDRQDIGQLISLGIRYNGGKFLIWFVMLVIALAICWCVLAAKSSVLILVVVAIIAVAYGSYYYCMKYVEYTWQDRFSVGCIIVSVAVVSTAKSRPS